MSGFPADKRRQRGLSLTELMIASTLGLLLVAGVVRIYTASQQAYRAQENAARLQENGLFALEFLSRDIRMAGFLGCASLAELHNNLRAGPGRIDIERGGIDGVEGGAAPDRLIIRGGSGGIPVTKQATFDPSLVQVAIADAKREEFELGDILLVSDCRSADVFQITDGNPRISGALVHKEGQGSSPKPPGNAQQRLSKEYGKDAKVMRLQETVYEVVGHTLRRNNQPLIEDVEDLQILYGEDTDGDRSANYYVSADQVTDMKQVVSVRVSLLLRSHDDNVVAEPQRYRYNGTTVTATDRRLRRVFTTTIQIRNRV